MIDLLVELQNNVNDFTPRYLLKLSKVRRHVTKSNIEFLVIATYVATIHSYECHLSDKIWNINLISS